MKKQEFLANQDVKSFISWASNYLPQISVHLKVSKKGTGSALGKNGPGIDKKILTFTDLVSAYHWRSEWSNKEGKCVFSDDWTSTQKSLAELSSWLKSEVKGDCHSGTLNAAKAIVFWGGDRSHLKFPPQGAIPFLEKIPHLPAYLSSAQSILALSTANTETTGPIKQMNAMLTKVHSLLADDGLPIYDSRVAGAISYLVEKYRRFQGALWSSVPSVLQFKATDRTNIKRRVNGLADLEVIDPGCINRANTEVCVADWVSAKIRLGWILEAVILRADYMNNPIIKANLSINQSTYSKMRALEAGLFMLGFDISCIEDDS